MARNARMGVLAVSSAALILISVLMLWMMPADPEETMDQALTYVMIGIYIVGLTLIGPVIYYTRVRRDSHPVFEGTEGDLGDAEKEDDESDDSSEYISDIEREFRALEMEIERDEQG